VSVNLLKMRRAMGWSQRHLASRVGVTRPTIANLESGRKRGSLALWDRLEDTFGVPQRWLRKTVAPSSDTGSGTRLEDRRGL
jgi:transcriptional regulator with XRE-family HTH domain